MPNHDFAIKKMYIEAPMKLLYDVARARQTQQNRQISCEAMIAGRLPNDDMIGTLPHEISAPEIAM